MSLFQFYSYIDGSLHVSVPQAHPQENSHSCSHNHWYSGFIVWAACFVCCGWSQVNSPEDGPVGPKHVEIRRCVNKIEIFLGFLYRASSIDLQIKVSNRCI
jgi:hypothetical protein